MTWLRRELVEDGSTPPWWWGGSHRDVTADGRVVLVCYPLPLNWVVGGWRRLQRGPRPRYGTTASVMDAEYRRGFQAGYQRGAEEARRTATEERLRWVIEPLRRALRPRRPLSHDLDEAVAQARRIPMSEVVAVNRLGYALCPFHDDHHPSLHVTAHLAYCFICARGWDSLGLVMERDHLTFVEAVTRLGHP